MNENEQHGWVNRQMTNALLPNKLIQRWIDQAASNLPQDEVGMTKQRMPWANIIALGENLLEAKRRLKAGETPRMSEI